MPSKSLILAAEDCPDQLELMERLLRDIECRLIGCPTADVFRNQLAQTNPDCVILDLGLGEEDGLVLLAEMTALRPGIPVIIVTGLGSVDRAVGAMKLGAHDFLPKPIDSVRLQVAVRNAVEHRRLVTRLQRLQAGSDDAEFAGILGVSPPMRAVFRIIENVAPTNASVMILGESGTGKELVARALHDRSRRPRGPFVPVNTAALAPTLVESLLFGHTKGSFTGAVAEQTGCCEQADGGTLFLDEIGEMPLELQPKLLRFLEDRMVRPVGGSRSRPVDVRFLSATNRKLEADVRAGRFREDLYYRLNVVPIELPPLRERHEDIPLLALHFLQKSAREHDRRFERLGIRTVDFLTAYSWPGNVRQLQNVIERAVILHNGEELEPWMLPAEVRTEAVAKTDSPASVRKSAATAPETAAAPIEPLEALEKRALVDALLRCDGNVAQAAARLGIGQSTLYRKIKSFGLKVSDDSIEPQAGTG